MPTIDTLEIRVASEQSTFRWHGSSDPDRVQGATFPVQVVLQPVPKAAYWSRFVDGLVYRGALGTTAEKRGGTLVMDAYWDGAIRNRRYVLAALTKNPKMNGLLIEAQKRLDPLFPNGRLVLEGDSDGEQLYLVIETALDVESARAVLDDFDRSWWLESMGPANGNLSVVLDLV